MDRHAVAHNSCVEFKGTKDGVLVLCDDQADFPVVRRTLEQKLESAGDFFEGAAVIVDVGSRVLTSEQLLAIERLITERYGVKLLQVFNGESEAFLADGTRSSAALPDVFSASLSNGTDNGSVANPADYAVISQRVFRGWGQDPEEAEPGLAAVSPETSPKKEASEGDSDPRMRKEKKRKPQGDHELQVLSRRAFGDTILVRRTLRSGQQVAHQGNIVVMGDVNPGGEVVAGGDILVMGSLRGIAHAGYETNQEAVVAGFWLEPLQLRIGSIIARSPETPDTQETSGPEVARVKNGHVIVEPYQRVF